MDELNKKIYIGLGGALLVALFLFGLGPYIVHTVLKVFMWLTQYILPWIFLYYFIQFYQQYARKQEKPPEWGGFRRLSGAVATDFFNLIEDELNVCADDDLNMVWTDDFDSRNTGFFDLILVDRIHVFDIDA